MFATGTGPNPTDRGKKGVKRSVLADGRGVPVGLAVDGANRPDFKMARETVESVERPEAEPKGRGRQHTCLDKGYDYAEVDELMQEFHFTAHIARRGGEPREIKATARRRRGAGWWSGPTAG